MISCLSSATWMPWMWYRMSIKRTGETIRVFLTSLNLPLRYVFSQSPTLDPDAVIHPVLQQAAFVNRIREVPSGCFLVGSCFTPRWL